MPEAAEKNRCQVIATNIARDLQVVLRGKLGIELRIDDRPAENVGYSYLSTPQHEARKDGAPFVVRAGKFLYTPNVNILRVLVREVYRYKVDKVLTAHIAAQGQALPEREWLYGLFSTSTAWEIGAASKRILSVWKIHGPLQVTGYELEH